MDLIYWVLILGIIFVIGAIVLAIVLVVNSEGDFLPRLVLMSFIIVLGFAGFTGISAFIIIALIDTVTPLSDGSLLTIASITTLIGTLTGVGVAFKFSNSKKDKCILDPTCEVI